jgi:ribosome biogenesis protein ERB1
LSIRNDPSHFPIRHHEAAIRQVAFHRHYPLFASCADDGFVHIFHGMVYNEMMKNPLIVPVRILRGHGIRDHLGVLDCEFHPHQPWILTCGADHTIRLYS